MHEQKLFFFKYIDQFIHDHNIKRIIFVKMGFKFHLSDVYKYVYSKSHKIYIQAMFDAYFENNCFEKNTTDRKK